MRRGKVLVVDEGWRCDDRDHNVRRDDPPILGANPFVGLTREQCLPRHARIGQRAAVEPGVAAATAVDALGEFVRIGIGRSDVAPARGDHRFTDATHRVIDEVELDTKSRAEPNFAMSLITEALAPTNIS